MLPFDRTGHALVPSAARPDAHMIAPVRRLAELAHSLDNDRAGNSTP